MESERQLSLTEAANRWKVPAGELKEPHRRREVLQPVLAESVKSSVTVPAGSSGIFQRLLHGLFERQFSTAVSAVVELASGVSKNGRREFLALAVPCAKRPSGLCGLHRAPESACLHEPPFAYGNPSQAREGEDDCHPIAQFVREAKRLTHRAGRAAHVIARERPVGQSAQHPCPPPCKPAGAGKLGAALNQLNSGRLVSERVFGLAC